MTPPAKSVSNPNKPVVISANPAKLFVIPAAAPTIPTSILSVRVCGLNVFKASLAPVTPSNTAIPAARTCPATGIPLARPPNFANFPMFADSARDNAPPAVLLPN